MMRILKTRKGVVETSLHWIFVMIIGAIILTFFITIVVKQKNVAETESLLDTRSTMENYIIGARSVERGGIPISSFGENIVYGCDSIGGICGCSFSLGDKNKISLDVDNSVVFSSKDLGGEKIIVSTLPWKFPYIVTNFVYFIPINERLIFSYKKTDLSLKNKVLDVFETLSDSINKEVIERDSDAELIFEDLNFNKRKIIIFGRLSELPKLPNFVLNKNTVVINIPSISNVADPVYFYEFEEKTNSFVKQKSSTFMDEPTLLGAIFSDDYDDYACGVQSAFTNLNSVNRVNLERTTLLEGKFDGCSTYYGEGDKSLFRVIDELTKDSEDWETIDFISLVRSRQDLEIRSTQIGEVACPLLY
jgi:hypothetical protein